MLFKPMMLGKSGKAKELNCAPPSSLLRDPALAGALLLRTIKMYIKWRVSLSVSLFPSSLDTDYGKGEDVISPFDPPPPLVLPNGRDVRSCRWRASAWRCLLNSKADRSYARTGPALCHLP